MSWEWVALPALGSFIGWITNRLAIRLLFRPHRPVRLLGVEVQGLLPRRRAELAKSVGRVLEERILTPEGLAARMQDPAVVSGVVETLKDVARQAFNERAGYLPSIIANPLSDYVAATVEREAEGFLTDRAGDWLAGLARELGVATTVQAELDALSLDDLEALVLELASRELRHIEILGAALGLIIGLFQAAVVTAIR